MRWRYLNIFFGLLVALQSFHYPCLAQYNVLHGVNRLQYARMSFNQYPGKQFALYVQEGSEHLDSLLLPATIHLLRELSDSLQLRVPQPLHIIVYHSPLSQEQSNIGLEFEKVNPGGMFPFNGNRLVLCYRGSLNLLLQDLRYEVISLLIRQAVYGNSVEQALRSFQIKTIPAWFVNGLIAYLSHGYSPEEDNRFQNFLLGSKVKTYRECLKWDAVVTTKALLHYLQERYGAASMRQLLFQLQTQADLDKALQHAFKKPQEVLSTNMLAFMAQRGIQDLSALDSLPHGHWQGALRLFGRSGGEAEVTDHFLLGAEGGVLLLSEDQQQHYLRPMAWGKRNRRSTCFLKTDKVQKVKNAPVVLFDPGNHRRLGVLFSKAGKWVFQVYGLQGKANWRLQASYRIPELHGVVSASFGARSGTVYLCGYRNGITDVFEFSTVKGTLRQVTFNAADETEVLWNDRLKAGVLTLLQQRKDSLLGLVSEIVLVDTTVKGAQAETLLQRKDSTVHIRQLSYGPDANLYFLSDEAGVANLYRMMKDGAMWRSECLTNTPKAILRYQFDGGKLLLSYKSDDSLGMYSLELDSLKAREPYVSTLRRMDKARAVASARPGTQLKENSGNKDEWPFFKADSTELKEFQQRQMAERTFDRKALSPYRLQLTSDYVAAQLDNTLLMNAYQPYFQNQGLFKQVTLGGMLKYAFTDLFEDYRAEVGVRIPSASNGSDFFVQVDNRRKRLDWGISYLRHSGKGSYSRDSNWSFLKIPGAYRQITHYGELKASYPFNARSKVQMTVGGRYDKQVFLAVDTFSLRYPDTAQVWTLARLEYVWNNTTHLEDNGRKGIFVRVFTEYHYQIGQSKSNFVHLGLEGRHYAVLYRHIVWANKLFAALSAGRTGGMYYVLGGTQQWLAPQVDSTARGIPGTNYSFLSYANSLRGYKQNIRGGNQVALLNSEIRIPVLHTFSFGKTKLTSINNLSIVPFMDIGNAWSRVSSTAWPAWVMGYGCGLHTNLLGYAVRFDFAWRTPAQGFTLKPMLVIGLGKDY